MSNTSTQAPVRKPNPFPQELIDAIGKLLGKNSTAYAHAYNGSGEVIGHLTSCIPSFTWREALILADEWREPVSTTEREDIIDRAKHGKAIAALYKQASERLCAY